MNIKDIIKSSEDLEQIPHRLEFINNNGVNILDDTYSSNEEGFLEALEVLNSFKGKKIIVTPGIVELGKESDKIHKNISINIARVADLVILISKSQRTSVLRNGLIENGFEKKNIIEANTNKEANEALQKH